jgi:hypothetical protein
MAAKPTGVVATTTVAVTDVAIFSYQNSRRPTSRPTFPFLKTDVDGSRLFRVREGSSGRVPS